MADKLIGTVTTDANGVATFSNLAPGSYKYVEKSARAGYTADTTPYPITITADTPITADRTNSPIQSGSITIVKHAEGYPLDVKSGATFKLMDSAGKTMKSVTAASGTDGKIPLTNLMSIDGTPQTYKLEEVTAPSGYNPHVGEISMTVAVGTNPDQLVSNPPKNPGSLGVTLTDTNYNEYGLTGSDYELYLVTP